MVVGFEIKMAIQLLAKPNKVMFDYSKHFTEIIAVDCLYFFVFYWNKEAYKQAVFDALNLIIF